MIFHKQKAVFLHVPKSAGQSIQKYFYDQGLSDWWWNPPTNDGCIPAFKFKMNREHASLDELKEFYGIDDQYFSFCFVRNPWARMVSYYFHLRKNKRGGGYRLFDARRIPMSWSFDEFVKRLLLSDFEEPKIKAKIPAKYFMSNCLYWAADADFVGRFENLQEDFELACEKAGLPVGPLPHVNATDKKPYWEYYTDELVALVAKAYQPDIAMFGYEFGK